MLRAGDGTKDSPSQKVEDLIRPFLEQLSELHVT